MDVAETGSGKVERDVGVQCSHDEESRGNDESARIRG